MLPRNAYSSDAEYHQALRDWFAGQAIAGFCADPRMTGSSDAGRLPTAAYAMADAMLMARSITKGSGDE